MPKTTSEQNKAVVLAAFDTLFNERDYAAAERFWSPDYSQHSAHIAPGRDGLFNLIKPTVSTTGRSLFLRCLKILAEWRRQVVSDYMSPLKSLIGLLVFVQSCG
jgi:hypothetical protein